MRRTPVLIFDFGNVVAFFDYAKACGALGEQMGVPGPELLERIRGAGFGTLLLDFESGRMTAPEFSAAVCGLAGVAPDHERFVRVWADIFTPNEPVGRLIGWLHRQGFTLVLGSNTNEIHAVRFRDQFASTIGCFDRLVLSFEVGHCKPSPEFYRACASAAGGPAASCLFIDDIAENVEGARAAGLESIRYCDPTTLIADLTRFGIHVPPDVIGP